MSTSTAHLIIFLAFMGLFFMAAFACKLIGGGK